MIMKYEITTFFCYVTIFSTLTFGLLFFLCEPLYLWGIVLFNVLINERRETFREKKITHAKQHIGFKIAVLFIVYTLLMFDS